MPTTSRIQPMTTTGTIPPVTTNDSPLESLFFPNRDTFPLETPDFLVPSDTGGSDPGVDLGEDRDIKSESIRPNPVYDHRFRDIVEKVESLPLDKAIKHNALTAIWLLIREVDRNQLNWVAPFIHSDYSKYMYIKWRRGTKSLSLNIDSDEQWWSKHWEEDNKIKTDFDTVDYTNLLIHWKWLIND